MTSIDAEGRLIIKNGIPGFDLEVTGYDGNEIVSLKDLQSRSDFADVVARIDKVAQACLTDFQKTNKASLSQEISFKIDFDNAGTYAVLSQDGGVQKSFTSSDVESSVLALDTHFNQVRQAVVTLSQPYGDLTGKGLSELFENENFKNDIRAVVENIGISSVFSEDAVKIERFKRFLLSSRLFSAYKEASEEEKNSFCAQMLQASGIANKNLTLLIALKEEFNKWAKETRQPTLVKRMVNSATSGAIPFMTVAVFWMILRGMFSLMGTASVEIGDII